MSLLEIAQLITSIATLFLAVTLLLQLRTNHKDSDIELTYRSLELGFNRIDMIVKNKEFRKIYLKRQSNKVKLSDEEEFVLDIFWRLHFSQMATDYRLGRAKRDKRYYELALGIVFDNKHICKWYLETGREIFGKQIGVRVRETSFLQEIADEQYKNIMGKEIKL